MPGSPSTVPSRIETRDPTGHVPPKRLEPQMELKGFDRATLGTVGIHEFGAGNQPEILAPHPPLRADCRPGVSTAPRAMAMSGPKERTANLVADAATEATASELRVHVPE